MANPYTVGPPVSYSHLYGRDELIQKCYQDVHNNIWLLGRRRSGKTSVLYAIEEYALNSEEWFPVYVTLEDCFSDADIKKSFLRDFRNNLAKFEMKEEYQLPDDNEYGGFVDLVDDICQGLNKCGIGLLLLLDEFEQIEELGEEGSRIIPSLGVILGRRGCKSRVIIAAARVLRTQRTAKSSPFNRLFASTVTIGPIRPQAARELILQEKNNDIEEMRLDGELIDEILNVTACEPYLCQYLCRRLYQSDNSLREIMPEDLTQLDYILDQMFALDYSYLEEGEKDILRKINQGEEIDPSSISVELIQLGYIRRINNQ